jgi:uncharacterized membrane protein
MILALVLACGVPAPADTGSSADTGACAVTWENWTEDFFTTYCDACHSARTPDRHGAPEGVTFDTEAETVAQIARVRARVLDAQTMPLGGGVFDDDLVLLRAWADCVDPAGAR